MSNDAITSDARISRPDATSPTPSGLRAALNQHYSESQRSAKSRCDDLKVEILDELTINHSMYVVNGIVRNILSMGWRIADQIEDHAWNRTFAERLEEVMQRYPSVDHVTLERELTTAWQDVQKAVDNYYASIPS